MNFSILPVCASVSHLQNGNDNNSIYLQDCWEEALKCLECAWSIGGVQSPLTRDRKHQSVWGGGDSWVRCWDASSRRDSVPASPAPAAVVGVVEPRDEVWGLKKGLTECNMD